ncbi:HTH-type transcriptional repressor GlcR [subsurface metagenome]
MQRTKLFIEERQKEILNYINEKERASIEDIINMFNISKATVRRDLIDLEKKNLVIRTRGGH